MSGNASSAPISLCAPRDAHFSSVTSSRDQQRRPGIDGGRGLGGRSGRRWSPGRRRSIRAASSRERASPRRTSSASSRAPTHPASPGAGGPPVSAVRASASASVVCIRSKTGTCSCGVRPSSSVEVVLDAAQQPVGVGALVHAGTGSGCHPGRRSAVVLLVHRRPPTGAPESAGDTVDQVAGSGSRQRRRVNGDCHGVRRRPTYVRQRSAGCRGDQSPHRARASCRRCDPGHARR